LFEDEFEQTDDAQYTDDITHSTSEESIRKLAGKVYELYSTRYKSRFKWLRAEVMIDDLKDDLVKDARELMKILGKCGEWNPEKDAKLNELFKLLKSKYSNDKVIVFTQFADTARYLTAQLKKRGIKSMEGVTGDIDDPTGLAWRFSPRSNEKSVLPEDELRILIATDVLSEGQNLQDCFITVNYDLPWAIIRLIQRIGRIDRIGQTHDNVYAYSFLPAEGVEKIIRLRGRVRQRLTENAEVVGTDEAFFEDDRDNQSVLDIYNEKAGIYDADADGEVDLASTAFQIWKNAIEANPDLKKIIPDMPNVVYSTRHWEPRGHLPEGVIVFVRTANDTDSLAWVDKTGKSMTESQFEILKAVACDPDTKTLPRLHEHHELVAKGVKMIVEEEKTVGGQLGRPSGARFRAYERLKRYAVSVKDTLFDVEQLHKTIQDIYTYPLTETAKDSLNRQMKLGIEDMKLAELVMSLREDGRLSVIHETEQSQEPILICSLGMVAGEGD
jgi:hypothetical protein